MPLYMYQAAYTPEYWAAQLENPQNRLKLWAVRHARQSAVNSLAVGIALANMISSLSAMCRTTKVCRQSRWLLQRAAPKASKTTVLMSGTEGVGALKKAGAITNTYKPA